MLRACKVHEVEMVATFAKMYGCSVDNDGWHLIDASD